MIARFRYFYSVWKVKIRVKKGQNGAMRFKLVHAKIYLTEKNTLGLGTLWIYTTHYKTTVQKHVLILVKTSRLCNIQNQ